MKKDAEGMINELISGQMNMNEGVDSTTTAPTVVSSNSQRSKKNPGLKLKSKDPQFKKFSRRKGV